MAHFAELDDNNVVIRVLVVPDEQEHRGQQFLAVDLDLGGRWIQCSYNNNIRKMYPGVGYNYDPTADVFYPAQPYPSWTLDDNHDWQPPVPRPVTGQWEWNEQNQEWVDVE